MPKPPPGPWASNWANNDVYPADIESWPGHERWFDQRTGISTCEYTIHQNNVVAAVVYGSLLGKPSINPLGGPDAGAGGADGGLDGGRDDDAARRSGSGDESDGGCGCRMTPVHGAWPVASGLLLLLLRLRRRRQ